MASLKRLGLGRKQGGRKQGGRRRGGQRLGGQIEGQIRETIREPDPIQIAQRLAAAGQQVPPELQKQVFQKAAADGMSSEALEQAFGMPPGTASQAAQDLGIAQQLPATLGGSMAPPGAQPPPPQQSPGQTANAIASQNQPPSPPTNLDDRMYEIDSPEGRAPENAGGNRATGLDRGAAARF